jgi:AcrR family transcriptional regulator
MYTNRAAGASSWWRAPPRRSTPGGTGGYIPGQYMPKAVRKKSTPAGRSAVTALEPATAPALPAKKRKRLDAYSLRSRIIGKAAGVFEKLGAADSTVEDILQAAEISRRTFYRFFQSKEDVLDALHEIGCNMLIGAARQLATSSGAPEERLKRAVEGYLDYHVTVGSNVMYVVQGESMRAGSRLAPRRRAFLETMASLLGDGMQEAAGVRVDPLMLRSLLVAMESVSMMLRAESEDGSFDMERAKQVMMRIVFASIAAPADAIVPPLPVLPAPTK